MKSIAELQKIFAETPSQELPVQREAHLLLPAAADAARQNLSLQTRFPAFWQQLLANSSLQKLFLEFIDLLNSQGEWQIPPLDAHRLHQVAPVAQVAFFSAEKWRVQWYQPAAQLNALLNQPSIERRTHQWTRSIPLFNSVVDLETGELELLLKLTVGVNSAEIYPVVLLDHVSETSPTLHVTLQWGTYEKTLPVIGHEVSFEPLSLTLIGDGTTVKSPLQLTVAVAG